MLLSFLKRSYYSFKRDVHVWRARTRFKRKFAQTLNKTRRKWAHFSATIRSKEDDGFI